MVILLSILFGVLVLAILGRTSIEKLKIPKNDNSIDQTFSQGVNRVEYESQGKRIIGNLYIPDDYKDGEKRPAIVVAPPATSLKEHAAGFYAEKFSKLGYITLAFDTRGIGESEGVEADANPYHHANDVASSVSFLSSLKQVDPDKLLNVGVCAGVVSATYETFQDSRIKALGIVVPSISGSELTRGNIFIVRWIIYVIGGILSLLNFFGINVKSTAIPDEDKLENASQGMKEVASYYPKGKVGYHPRWKNAISATSLPGIAKLHIFNYANKFDNIPVYMVTGEEAYSFEPAVRFYDSLKGPKDSLVLKEANHVQFYWKDEYADQAVEGIDTFFKSYL